MRFSSTSTPASGMTSEPVAMMMFFASSIRSPPSPVTATLPAAAIRPLPRTRSILFFLNRKSMPLTLPDTISALAAISLATSIETLPVLMPKPAKPVCASSYMCEACRSALDGMQPTFVQVPPSVFSFSTQATVMPSCAARIAAM